MGDNITLIVFNNNEISILLTYCFWTYLPYRLLQDRWIKRLIKKLYRFQCCLFLNYILMRRKINFFTQFNQFNLNPVGIWPYSRLITRFISVFYFVVLTASIINFVVALLFCLILLLQVREQYFFFNRFVIEWQRTKNLLTNKRTHGQPSKVL